MISALNLRPRPSRTEEDGFLTVVRDGAEHTLLFECKSSPVNDDFGTGRDTGIPKLESWQEFHFVFAWFEPRDNVPLRMWYGSPRLMHGWIDREKAYLTADLKLVDLLPGKADAEAVDALLGIKDFYTYEEIRTVVKNQWFKDGKTGQPNLYDELADLRRGHRSADHLYSFDVAIRAVRDRSRYLLARGSTVNNRKIPKSYILSNCLELDPDGWAHSLRQCIDSYLDDISS